VSPSSGNAERRATRHGHPQRAQLDSINTQLTVEPGDQPVTMLLALG
jgi:hypothetical protein